MSEELDSIMESSPVEKDHAKEVSAKTLAMIVYALQAISFLLGFTFIVAVIVNYIKKDDVRGTVAESHFRWQMRTFWFSFLWGVLGFILVFIIVGYVILLANAIWVIYRIVKGWLNLNDAKIMYG